MPGDLPTAVDVDDRGSRIADRPVERAGALARGVDRPMLEQQAGVRDLAGHAPLVHLALNIPRGAVVKSFVAHAQPGEHQVTMHSLSLARTRMRSGPVRWCRETRYSLTPIRVSTYGQNQSGGERAGMRGRRWTPWRSLRRWAHPAGAPTLTRTMRLCTSSGRRSASVPARWWSSATRPSVRSCAIPASGSRMRTGSI